MIAIGGENLIDLVSSSFNPEGLPIYLANPGGSPYNVAIAASKQGGNVSYLTPPVSYTHLTLPTIYSV